MSRSRYHLTHDIVSLAKIDDVHPSQTVSLCDQLKIERENQLTNLGVLLYELVDAAMLGCQTPKSLKYKQKIGVVSCRKRSIKTQTGVISDLGQDS